MGEISLENDVWESVWHGILPTGIAAAAYSYFYYNYIITDHLLMVFNIHFKWSEHGFFNFDITYLRLFPSKKNYIWERWKKVNLEMCTVRVMNFWSYHITQIETSLLLVDHSRCQNWLEIGNTSDFNILIS